MPQLKEMTSVVNLHLRKNEVFASRFDLYNNRMADLIIKPELGDMHWNDFQRYAYAMEKGREVTEKNLPDIKRVDRHSQSPVIKRR